MINIELIKLERDLKKMKNGENHALGLNKKNEFLVVISNS